MSSNIIDKAPDLRTTPLNMPWLEPQEGHVVAAVAEVVGPVETTEVVSVAKEDLLGIKPPKNKKRRQNEEQRRAAMREYFQDHWKELAASIVEVANDPEAKPSERISAIKTAMEFGFGRAATQEPITTSKVPELKIGVFPSVAEMKARGSAQTKPH